YEQEAYEDLIRNTPRQGAIVMTAEGRGVVSEVSLLRGKLTVRMDNDEGVVKVFKKEDVKVIKNQSQNQSNASAQMKADEKAALSLEE
ncbi:MAG: stage 0 sporulation protein, partial [Oscillospiraceae bacterium]